MIPRNHLRRAMTISWMPDITMEDSQDSLSRVRNKALALLSRRELSTKMLRDKLHQKEFHSKDIETVIEDFTERGWLSDTRFMEVFCRDEISKGHGKMKLMWNGRNKGLDEKLLNQHLNEQEIDWFNQAVTAYNRRFFNKPIADFKDKSKRLRYLVSRGFSYEEANYALSNPDADI